MLREDGKPPQWRRSRRTKRVSFQSLSRFPFVAVEIFSSPVNVGRSVDRSISSSDPKSCWFRRLQRWLTRGRSSSEILTVELHCILISFSLSAFWVYGSFIFARKPKFLCACWFHIGILPERHPIMLKNMVQSLLKTDLFSLVYQIYIWILNLMSVWLLCPCWFYVGNLEERHPIMVKTYEVEFIENWYIFSVLSDIYLDPHSYACMITTCMLVLYWEFGWETSDHGKTYRAEFCGNRFIFNSLSTVYLDRHSHDWMSSMCIHWEFGRETSDYGKKKKKGYWKLIYFQHFIWCLFGSSHLCVYDFY